MRTRKHTFIPAEGWETGALEAWLEDEAAKGWRLADSGSRLAAFDRAEPARCRVRLQPKQQETAEAWQERTDAYGAMGWTYAGELRGQEVYYCDDPAAAELESDPVAQRWAWEKSLKRSRREAWLGLLALAALGAWAFWGVPDREAPVDWLLEKGPAMVLLVAIIALGVLAFLRQLAGIRKTRCLLAAGIAPAHTGGWKRSRRFLLLAEAVMLVFWALQFAGIFYPTAPCDLEDPGLPYVPVESLGEREYGYADRAWQPLAPERYDILEVFSDQRRVETAWDRLRFAALAEPLYREKLENFLSDWPDAAITAVEDPAFHRAAVLTGDQGVSLFLARRGNVVFSVWTNADLDLTTYIEAFAAILAAEGGA